MDTCADDLAPLIEALDLRCGAAWVLDGRRRGRPLYRPVQRRARRQGRPDLRRATLNIGDGSTAGIVAASRVDGDDGTAILNFNRSDPDYYFARDGTASGTAVRITGSTAVNQIGTGQWSPAPKLTPAAHRSAPRPLRESLSVGRRMKVAEPAKRGVGGDWLVVGHVVRHIFPPRAKLARGAP